MQFDAFICLAWLCFAKTLRLMRDKFVIKIVLSEREVFWYIHFMLFSPLFASIAQAGVYLRPNYVNLSCTTVHELRKNLAWHVSLDGNEVYLLVIYEYLHTTVNYKYKYPTTYTAIKTIIHSLYPQAALFNVPDYYFEWILNKFSSAEMWMAPFPNSLCWMKFNQVIVCSLLCCIWGRKCHLNRNNCSYTSIIPRILNC